MVRRAETVAHTETRRRTCSARCSCPVSPLLSPDLRWFLYASNGPHLSWSQLTDFHSCDTGGDAFLSLRASGYDCDIFHDPRPSTVSLSILVTIEMFNALNALSENQSLLVVTPLSNPYVLLACVLSFLLHITIVYVPFLASVFHVAPLNAEEWLHVLYLSLPIFLLDEMLKAISRYTTGNGQRRGCCAAEPSPPHSLTVSACCLCCPRCVSAVVACSQSQHRRCT